MICTPHQILDVVACMGERERCVQGFSGET
jgi:hypothetical protein